MRIKTKVLYYEKEKISSKNYTTVIVDILRASSSITTILSKGALWVKPVMDADEAFRVKKEIPNVLLAGEINTFKIDGFDFGNSPLEFLESDLIDKKMVLTTTNGTKAIVTHQNNSEVLIGCFLNIDPLVSYLEFKENILLVCSGSHGEFSLEDFLFCGRLIERLSTKCKIEELDDASRTALKLSQSFENDFWNFIREGTHAKVLISKGFEKDVDFCLQENVFDLIPFLDKDGCFKIFRV